MKASRRSRGAREMGKKREKREAEKNKKKKKKKRGLLARTIGSLAGCTRARNYVSRLACGLEKRQQDGRSGGRWPAKLGGRSWLVEDCGAGMERMVAGSSGRLAPEGNVLTGGKHRVL